MRVRKLYTCDSIREEENFYISKGVSRQCVKYRILRIKNIW